MISQGNATMDAYPPLKSKLVKAACIALFFSAVSLSQAQGHSGKSVQVVVVVQGFAAVSQSSTAEHATTNLSVSLAVKNDNGTLVRDTSVQAAAPTFVLYCWANTDSTLIAEIADDKLYLDETTTVPVAYSWTDTSDKTSSIAAGSTHLSRTLALDIDGSPAYSGTTGTDQDGNYTGIVVVTIAVS